MSIKPPAQPSRPGKLSRRKFIQSSAAVATTGALSLPQARADAPPINIEAYTSATSIAPGGTLVFYARDPQAAAGASTPYTLTICRASWPDDVFMTSAPVSLSNQVVPADASTNGCRWAPSLTLLIPKTWPSGLYYASIGGPDNQCNVPFVVKAVSSTPGVKILVQMPVTTVHAYNPYGGKSLYGYNSTGGVPATQVSFDRPFSEWYNSSFDGWQYGFVRWLAKRGIAADYCTSVDLHANANQLKPYQLVISAGHDEYWSQEMRNAIDSHLARGGNVGMFTGNTCWWQARFAASSTGANRTLVSYKEIAATADPIANRKLLTTTWQALVPANPENTTTGLSFIRGDSFTAPVDRPSAPFATQRPEHWAFAGTGLAQNAPFGGAYVGYEVDAADVVAGTDGRLYPTGLDSAPIGLRVLAQASTADWNAAPGLAGVYSGHASCVVFSRGAGTLFNGSSTDWAYGLDPELNGQTPTVLSQITMNVITKLSQPWTESADVRQWRLDVAGNPSLYYYTTGTQPVAGTTLDGLAFRGYLTQASGTVPVYRYRYNGGSSATPRTILSTTRLNAFSALIQGLTMDAAPAFYAYASSRTGAVAVYQYRGTGSNGAAYYRYGTSQTPPAGWSLSGVAFYAPAA